MIYQAICPNRARDAARRIMSGRSTPLVWIESIDRDSGSRSESRDVKQARAEGRQSGAKRIAQKGRV